MSFFSNIWLNVLNAILIRDVKVRAGPYFTGYVFVFLLPFLHLSIVVAIFSILQRVPSVGTDGILYYGLSILPFVIFQYPSQQIMRSIAANAPLLYFSRVKFPDIIFARGGLEIVNGFLVSFLVMSVLEFWSGDFYPEHPFLLIYSLICTLLFGFALGCMSALIAQIFPMWMYVFGIAYPIFWLSSGVIFYPHAVPFPFSYYLHYNPLLICIESLRYSYYFSYPDTYFNLNFVVWLSIFLLAISLFFERIGRRLLLGA